MSVNRERSISQLRDGKCDCACRKTKENERVCPCLVESVNLDGVSTLTCHCAHDQPKCCQSQAQSKVNVDQEDVATTETETDEDDDNVFLNTMQMQMGAEYLNMPLDSKLSKTLLVKKEFTRLTVRPVLSAKLIVNKRGFLPGETLTFTLTFKNCTKNIVKLAVALVQKVKYIGKDGGTTKATTAVLVQKKLTSTDQKFEMGKDGKIVWSSSFPIPTFIMPSLSKETNKSVEITYCVQYALEAQGKPWAGVLSGEAPVVIGTTRKGFSLIPEGHSFVDSPRGSSSTMHSVGSLDSVMPLSHTEENPDKPKSRRVSLMLIPERQETTYGILRLKVDNNVDIKQKRNRTMSDHDPTAE